MPTRSSPQRKSPRQARAAASPAKPAVPAKTAAKSPAKAAAKAPVKAKTKAPVKTQASMKAAPAPAVPQATKPTRPAKADKPPKRSKPVLVRDGFAMPQADFDLIAVLKLRAMAAGREAKKSELLRAGLQALAALDGSALVVALGRLEPVKVGRPKKGH